MKKSLLLVAISSLLYQQAFSQDNQTEDILKKHVRILTADSLEGRGLGTEGAERARNYIINEFREAGIEPFESNYIREFQFRLGVAWLRGQNIIGYIEGSHPALKNEFILIGAHYDHLGYNLSNDEKIIFHGADDNASGVASIIEIGRYFSNNPHLLGRSLIIVAFDAEESGLWGSKYFMINPPVKPESIKLMFSLDMVGMYAANKGLDLVGIASFIDGESLAKNLAAKQSVSLRKTSDKIERQTDTAPFGDKGIPAVHVFTGMNSPYHKPEDQWQLLDYEGINLINNYLVQLVEKTSVTSELTPAPSLLVHAGKSQIRKNPPPGIGYILNTGAGYHHYKNEFFRANNAFNFSTGIFAELPLSHLFSVQQEILYDFNGSAISEGNFRRHSITLPLNLQFGTSRSGDIPVRFYVLGGAYYRYNFAGKTAGEKMDYVNEYERNEWGYNAGIAMDIFRFTTGFTMRKGLTSITKNGLPEIYDRNAFFTFGYRF